MTTSRVPRSCCDIASERMASEVRPPALRMTWASPSWRPRALAGSYIRQPSPHFKRSLYSRDVSVFGQYWGTYQAARPCRLRRLPSCNLVRSHSRASDVSSSVGVEQGAIPSWGEGEIALGEGLGVAPVCRLELLSNSACSHDT